LYQFKRTIITRFSKRAHLRLQEAFAVCVGAPKHPGEDGHEQLREVFKRASEVRRISGGFADGVLLHYALYIRAVCRRDRAFLDAVTLVLGLFHGRGAYGGRRQHRGAEVVLVEEVRGAVFIFCDQLVA
jgi:hypothetical protein